MDGEASGWLWQRTGRSEWLATPPLRAEPTTLVCRHWTFLNVPGVSFVVGDVATNTFTDCVVLYSLSQASP